MPQIPNAYYRTSVKALVLNEEGKILLTKEKSGIWNLPGGGIDWGEDPRLALQREIREEMGIETVFIAEHPSYFLTVITDHADPVWMSNIIYTAQLKHLDFTPSDECIEIGFFSVEDAKKLQLFSNVTKFLELYDPKLHIL